MTIFAAAAATFPHLPDKPSPKKLSWEQKLAIISLIRSLIIKNYYTYFYDFHFVTYFSHFDVLEWTKDESKLNAS